MNDLNRNIKKGCDNFNVITALNLNNNDFNVLF